MNKISVSLLMVGCLLKACQSRTNDQQIAAQSTIKYAKGFEVTALEHAKLIRIITPYQGATSELRYLLVEKGFPVPNHTPDTRVIFTPVERIVCTSTSHIPLLDYLGVTDKLVGFTTTDYISSEKMRKRIDNGFVKDLGSDKGIDLELLTLSKPDLVMTYAMSSDFGQYKKIEDLAIPVVINAEYLEQHPLGRAEWIKFTALFFHKEKEADSVFAMIERNYQQTAERVKNTPARPMVMSGIMYGGHWFLPGGQNYAAQLFRDAGFDYLWSDDSTSGFLSLSLEAVYQKAKDADYWIGVGAFKSLEELRTADHRYEIFKPFKTKNVFTYDARKGTKGGSEFLELGYLRPDIILNDLVRIAHPELLSDHDFYFHRKLE